MIIKQKRVKLNKRKIKVKKKMKNLIPSKEKNWLNNNKIKKNKNKKRYLRTKMKTKKARSSCNQK